MFIGICSRSQVSVYRTIGPLVVLFQESPQPVTSSPAPQEDTVHKPVPTRPHRPHAPPPQYQEPITVQYQTAAQPILPQQQTQAQPAFLQSKIFDPISRPIGIVKNFHYHFRILMENYFVKCLIECLKISMFL